MFDKAKNFMMRKMLERQLANVPADQKQMILTMIEKDPKLFEKIATEMQAEIKAGKTQMAAAMKVMPKYQAQLQALMGGQAPLQQKGSTVQFNQNGTIHK